MYCLPDPAPPHDCGSSWASSVVQIRLGPRCQDLKANGLPAEKTGSLVTNFLTGRQVPCGELSALKSFQKVKTPTCHVARVSPEAKMHPATYCHCRSSDLHRTRRCHDNQDSSYQYSSHTLSFALFGKALVISVASSIRQNEA